jgi:hypothetical protein
MVGYDHPQVTNDMITRFMGIDFELLPGQEASAKGRVGGVLKPAIGVVGAAVTGGVPLFKGGSTDWEGEQRFIPVLVQDADGLQPGIMQDRPFSSCLSSFRSSLCISTLDDAGIYGEWEDFHYLEKIEIGKRGYP